tara:strand:- start:228 stop:440 length:213 start_codon:yes stop_codon:yes gene_type:complete
MPECTFCRELYTFPRGLTLVLNDGKVLYFCSSKCKKNFDLKRDSKKVNWVKREKKIKKPAKSAEVAEKSK